MPIYYGESTCQAICGSGTNCRNKAYWLVKKQYLCGMHSKSQKRTELPKNPNAKADREQLLIQRRKLVKKTAKKNRKQGKIGDVILTKMYMMRDPEHVDGYLKVYPNYKHQNRQDGYGCMALSPKAMGPINHGQPGLPIAKNLENFHQGNKVFRSETHKKNPTDDWYKIQKRMYKDPEPHRHKDAAKTIKGNKNIPLYSIWRRADGTEIKISYIESRQFYCTFYERIARKLPEFKYLKTKLAKGYNLQIIGYDAYPITKTIEEHYLDDSKPFGHELVLYTMLVESDPKKYPWRIHKTEVF